MLARIDLRGTSGDLRARARAPAGRGPTTSSAAVAGDHRRRARARRRSRCASCTAALRRRRARRPRGRPAEIGGRARAARSRRCAPRSSSPATRSSRGTRRSRSASREHERLGRARSRELVVPVDRAGCYVPGGRAPLASSVLMTALPARVAGVPDVVLCTPPDADGTVHDAILAAAALAEVDEVYRDRRRAGDRRAGVRHRVRSPPVDVIVGPGNAYVAEAKRQVAADVGIDGYAGPSEVAVVADDTVDPVLGRGRPARAGRARPGRRGRASITWDEAVGRRGRARARRAARRAPRARRGRSRRSTPAGGVIARRRTRAGDRRRQRDRARAPRAHVRRRRRSSCRSCATRARCSSASTRRRSSATTSPASNHVLPTGGTARFADALRVDDFQKHMHVVSLEPRRARASSRRSSRRSPKPKGSPRTPTRSAAREPS